jgi:hypothetical protein
MSSPTGPRRPRWKSENVPSSRRFYQMASPTRSDQRILSRSPARLPMPATQPDVDGSPYCRGWLDHHDRHECRFGRWKWRSDMLSLIAGCDHSPPKIETQFRQIVLAAVVPNGQVAVPMLPHMSTTRLLTLGIPSFVPCHVDVSGKGNTQRNLLSKTCLAGRLPYDRPYSAGSFPLDHGPDSFIHCGGSSVPPVSPPCQPRT